MNLYTEGKILLRGNKLLSDINQNMLIHDDTTFSHIQCISPRYFI